MSRSIFLILFVCLSLSSRSQNGPLFEAKKIDSDFFVTFGGAFSWVDEESAAFTSFSLNWLMNHKIHLGANFVTLTTLFDISEAVGAGADEKVSFKFYQAGFNGGYLYTPIPKLTIDPEIDLNWGQLRYEYPADTLFKEAVFVTSPRLNIQYNASPNFRFGISGSYRFVFGSEEFVYSNEELSGFSVMLFIRAGIF